MTSCIEYVFIENLIINYIVIYNVNIFTKSKIKKMNLLIGILIISFYTTVNYYISSRILTNILAKMFVVSFSIYIIYMPKKIKQYIKLYAYYFFISFLLVGIVISVTLIFRLNISNIVIKIIIYIISSVLLFIFNKFMWKMWKTRIKEDNLIYTLKVDELEVTAFVDTGNNVYDYTNNLDVIFIEKKFLHEILKGNRLLKKIKLNINTVTGSNDCNGYILENVKVLKNKKEVFKFNKVVFIFIDRTFNNEEYRALISYDTYIEKLKGVVLC